VVVDLPRRDDPATLAALWRSDLLVLLVPDHLRAVAAARAVRDLLAPHAGDLRLVVSAGRAGLGVAEVADALDLPVLARTGPEPGLRGLLERGEPLAVRRRGALARCCAAVLAALDAEAPAVGAA
jgi:hypothetical protein